MAIEAGADILGFVFYPRSPRYVTPKQAEKIISALHTSATAGKLGGAGGGNSPAAGVRFAGVFVDELPEQVRAVMETAGLDLAQLHGSETPEMVRALGGRAYKSLQARDLDSAGALMANYRDAVNGNLPAFIADAPPAKLPGGNGMIADWSVAREIAKQFPILLAGGLNVENVREAMVKVEPWGLDVSSGVERAPGLKDHEKVREFIRRAKG